MRSNSESTLLISLNFKISNNTNIHTFLSPLLRSVQQLLEHGVDGPPDLRLEPRFPLPDAHSLPSAGRVRRLRLNVHPQRYDLRALAAQDTRDSRTIAEEAQDQVNQSRPPWRQILSINN